MQNKATEIIESEDVEERGSLTDRLLFWLLKHPCQRGSDLSFVFQVHITTIWRQLERLKERTLVESLTSAIAAPNRPDVLYYLTAGGIKHVACLVANVDSIQLAHMWQANETELLRLLPRLHQGIPLQETVQRLIADAPHQLAYQGGYPAAIRWHWQRDYRHTFERKKKSLTFQADGAVVFRRRPLRHALQMDMTETWYCFLFILDSGFHSSEDLRLMRKRLEQMLLWRESSERWSFYHAFPTLLIVAPTTHQRDLWIHSAQEAAAHLRVAPLKGAGAMLVDGTSPWRFSWQQLDGSGVTSLHSLVEPIVPPAIPPGLLAPKQRGLETVIQRGKGERIVVFGDFERRSKLLETNEATLKTIADFSLFSLHFSYRHINLLQQIYALPLIAPHELTTLLRREANTQRRYLYDLRHMHVVETITTVCGKRLLLTEIGLRLIAAMMGASLMHIAERNASTQQWQQRGIKQPLRTINHTAGIYTFLARLQEQAWKIGQEVLWWETMCCLRHYHFQGAWHNLMPDALFEYQAKEKRVEAWLEWDTGSMHRRPLTVKFEAYAQYVRSQHYRQEHLTPPNLLLVAPHNGREEMLRQIVASVIGSLPLPVWTTTEPLLKVQGPLAAIWKQMRLGLEESEVRLPWI